MERDISEESVKFDPGQVSKVMGRAGQKFVDREFLSWLEDHMTEDFGDEIEKLSGTSGGDWMEDRKFMRALLGAFLRGVTEKLSKSYS